MAKKKRIPQFTVTVGDDYEDFDNVICTSFVDDPATQKLYAVFSNEKTEGQFDFKITPPTSANEQVINDKNGKFERVVSGVWFMPNTDYPRRGIDGEVFTTSIDRPELKKAVSNYIKAGSANNFNVMHDGELVDGLQTMEIWVLNDHLQRSPILNNSIEDLGYKKENIPLGTVFMTVFIENKDFFNDNILSGKLKGFSIEAFFNLNEKQEMSKNVKQKAMFAAYGLNQETGEFVTSKGALKFSADGTIKLGDKTVTNGTIKLSNKFSIVVQDGKVCDFGFESEGGEGGEVVIDDAAAATEAAATAAAAAETAATEKAATEAAAAKVETDRLAQLSEVDKAVEKALAERATTEAKAKEAADKVTADAAKKAATDKQIEDLKKEVEAAKKSRGITPRTAKVTDDYDKETHRVVSRGGQKFLVLKG